MRMLKLACLAMLALPLRPAYASASAGTEEQLAGEQDAAKTPEPKPGAEEPQGGGEISLTRSARPVPEPSFQLPQAVVTGSGERKAISKRPELSAMMDTSGGIKASPSEQNASKDQLGAVGLRQNFENLTASSRPAYGQVRALYGWDNTFEGDAFWGEEAGSFYYLLGGNHDFSDGGPSDLKLATLDQSSDSGLFAHGGWRQDSGAQWSLQGSGRWRDRLWTRSFLDDPRLSRSLYEASLAYESAPGAFLKHDAKLSASSAEQILPGQGTVYSEGLLDASLDLEKEIYTRESRTLLSASLYAKHLDQDHGQRLGWLSGGDFMAHLEPWAGARLGLGLALQDMSLAPDVFLLAPRADFEQRLGEGLGVWARFAPGLELPTLAGQAGQLFEKDPALPGPATQPSKDSLNLQGGLSAALPRNIGLEIKGFVRQNEDALQLDDASGSGLWTMANVRGMRVEGAALRADVPESPSLSSHLSLGFQDSHLIDSPGLVPTFAPAWSGEAGLDWGLEPWKAGLSLAYTGLRQARLAGGESLPATFDLGFSASYALSENLTLLAQGRNLLAQQIEEFPGYAEPSPFVGLGAVYQF